MRLCRKLDGATENVSENVTGRAITTAAAMVESRVREIPPAILTNLIDLIRYWSKHCQEAVEFTDFARRISRTLPAFPKRRPMAKNGQDVRDDLIPTPRSAREFGFDQVRNAIQGIQFGEVRVIIQNGVIVQIERVEKQRL